MLKSIKTSYLLYSIVLIINGLNVFLKNYYGINIIQLNAVSIIILNFFLLKNFFLESKGKIFIVILVYIFFFFLSVFWGILNGNFFSFLFLDTVYFSCFCITLFHSSKSYYSEKDHLMLLKDSLYRPLIILLPFAIALLIKIGLSPVKYLEDRFNPELEIDPYSAISLLSPSIILLLFDFKNNSLLRKLIIIGSFFIIILFAFFTLSRGLILSICCVFIYIGKDFFLNFNYKLLFNIFLCSIILLLVILNLYDFGLLIDNYELLYERFFNNNDFSNGRDEEEAQFLESLTNIEWFFGRGFGGANTSWIFANTPNGSPIIHKWYLHLILKGGLIYLVLFLIVLVFSFSFFLSARKSFISRYFFYFLISSIGYTPFYSYLSISIFWYSVGFLLNKSNFNRVKSEV
jgi:hypothetical protein